MAKRNDLVILFLGLFLAMNSLPVWSAQPGGMMLGIYKAQVKHYAGSQTSEPTIPLIVAGNNAVEMEQSARAVLKACSKYNPRETEFVDSWHVNPRLLELGKVCDNNSPYVLYFQYKAESIDYHHYVDYTNATCIDQQAINNAARIVEKDIKEKIVKRPWRYEKLSVAIIRPGNTIKSPSQVKDCYAIDTDMFITPFIITGKDDVMECMESTEDYSYDKLDTCIKRRDWGNKSTPLR